MREKLLERIMYHKTCMRECEERVKQIQEQYEIETRQGLDEYQLQVLLVWRKESIAEVRAERNLHHIEKNWLAEILSEEPK